MRLSRKGKGGAPPKSVALEVLFWMTSTGSIHIATNDPDASTFHVSVIDDPTKARGHPSLYRELAKCLKKMGAPAPEK